MRQRFARVRTGWGCLWFSTMATQRVCTWTSSFWPVYCRFEAITSNHSCLLNFMTRVRTRDTSRDKWPYTHCTLCICSHTSESTLRWRRCVRLVSTKCLGMIRSVCVWCYIFLYIYTSRNLMLYLHFGSNEEQLRCVRHSSAQLFCILLDAAKSLLCNNTTYASRKHHSASEPFVTPLARVWPDLLSWIARDRGSICSNISLSILCRRTTAWAESSSGQPWRMLSSTDDKCANSSLTSSIERPWLCPLRRTVLGWVLPNIS